MLIDGGFTLAVAESCTGGMVTSSLVDVPGCSKFFVEGCVTYSNEAKINRLGVTTATLDRFGAVSEPCAREMAEGLRKTSGADYALATTGFAGPDGGTQDAPVGTVLIALAAADGTQIKRIDLHGDRARIRTIATLHALDLLRRKLCT
jgi:nicotinamide-nucleotide amidase